MSNFRFAAFARATVLAGALLVPAVSAFAADVINPVPDLSGQKISKSEVEVIATPLNPHPELNGQASVAVATTAPHK
jgi:hypothetical protein